MPLEKISLIRGSDVNIETYKLTQDKSKLVTIMLVGRMLKDKGVDQFVSGAFGGVLYRALTLGQPVFTYLDDSGVSSSYGATPLVFNCSNEKEIVEAIISAINNPSMLDSIGSRGKDWMNEYLSGKQTVITQLELIKSVLENKKSMNR